MKLVKKIILLSGTVIFLSCLTLSFPESEFNEVHYGKEGFYSESDLPLKIRDVIGDLNGSLQWKELVKLYGNTVSVCLISVDETSVKMKDLFQLYSLEDFGKISDKILVTGYSGSLAEDGYEADLFEDGYKYGLTKDVYEDGLAKDGYEDPISKGGDIISDIETFLKSRDIGFTEEDMGTRHQPEFIHRAEMVLRSLEQACSSLPKILPSPRSRHPRSPEKMVKRIVVSLTKWMERWVDTVEAKLDKFIDSCLSEEPCRPYLVKYMEDWVMFFHNKQDLGDQEASSILDEALHDMILGIRKPSMEGLNLVQRLALSDHFEGLENTEENVFDLAIDKYSHIDDESNFFLLNNLGVFRALMSSMFEKKFASQKTTHAAELEIETNRVEHVVSESFLSVGVGSSLMKEHWKGLKSKYSELLTLGAALSPAVLRVGGSDANFLTFDPLKIDMSENEIGFDPIMQKFVYSEHHPKVRQRNLELLEAIQFAEEKSPASSKHPKHRQEHQLAVEKAKFKNFEELCEPQLTKDFSNFTVTENDMEFLTKLTRDLGWTLIFDLNQFWRDSEGKWDPSNAREIIKNFNSAGVPVIWQLGNEPNAYHHKFHWEVSPEQMAEDFRRLHEEVLHPGQDLKIVGPDVTRPLNVASHEGKMEDEIVSQDSIEFLTRFLELSGDVVDAVTWHQYYVDGKTATLDDFLSPEIMNLFPLQLEKLVSVRDRITPEKPVWISETANAWGGGAPGLSNRFVGGFLWMDKLGAAALGGADLIVRQTLYGGCYSLLDPLLEPYPDYWVTLLHKKLAGQKVLLPRMRLAPASIRIYAHCLNINHELYRPGAVLIFGMNLRNKPERLQLLSDELRSSEIFKFELTAPHGDLTSRHTLLNGQLLELSVNGKIPPLLPVHERESGDLQLGPYSMTFWVLPAAAAMVC